MTTTTDISRKVTTATITYAQIRMVSEVADETGDVWTVAMCRMALTAKTDTERMRGRDHAVAMWNEAHG